MVTRRRPTAIESWLKGQHGATESYFTGQNSDYVSGGSWPDTVQGGYGSSGTSGSSDSSWDYLTPFEKRRLAKRSTQSSQGSSGNQLGGQAEYLKTYGALAKTPADLWLEEQRLRTQQSPILTGGTTSTQAGQYGTEYLAQTGPQVTGPWQSDIQAAQEELRSGIGTMTARPGIQETMTGIWGAMKPAIGSITGTPEAQAVGRTVQEMLSPEYAEAERKRLTQQSQSALAMRREAELQRLRDNSGTMSPEEIQRQARLIIESYDQKIAEAPALAESAINEKLQLALTQGSQYALGSAAPQYQLLGSALTQAGQQALTPATEAQLRLGLSELATTPTREVATTTNTRAFATEQPQTTTESTYKIPTYQIPGSVFDYYPKSGILPTTGQVATAQQKFKKYPATGQPLGAYAAGRASILSPSYRLGRRTNAFNY